MRSRLAACVASLLIAASAAAQQIPTPQSRNPNPKGKGEVTLIGCVEPEKDYRTRLGAAKGGPLGSTVGQADEFVLSSAKPAPANSAALTRKEAVATAGENGDYELTGKSEADLKQAIGRQIEVIGVVQPFEVHESAKDSRDRLPRLMISSWHRVADSCAGAQK
jgi:hypothetical protein